jgi:CheY-like chemotaxis protein
MIRSAVHFMSCLALLLFFLPPVRSQVEDYRQYFKPPETVQEYWTAIKFELELGAFKTAAMYLKGFMEKPPTEKDLLDIEAKDGMSSFLKLRSVAKWSDDPKEDEETKKRIEELIEAVTNIIKTHLADPQRIAKLVGQLGNTPGERLYAIRELRRSGPYGIPHLVKELREAEQTDRFTAIVGALPYLSRDAMPALLAALDINDPILRTGIVDGIRKRPDLMLLTSQWDTNPVPHLWYLAFSTKQPEYLRSMAKSTLAAILQTHPDKLPPARTELTREAERFYNHKVKFINPQNVPLWRWNGQELILEAASASRAEEHHGLRFAQMALDIDPAYPPAQVLALSIVVDKGVETAGLDKPLAAAPRLKELLTTINPDVVSAALDRAIDERRTAVALGTVRALGDLFEHRAGRGQHRSAPALVRALNYPDRRVQFAAADAVLRMPGPPPSQAPGRVVDILRRIVQSDPGTKVLIVDFNQDRGLLIGEAIKEAGFVPVVVRTGREALDRLREAADIDAILLDHETPDPGLRSLLPQLRQDIDIAQLPLFVTVPPLAVGVRPPETTIQLQRIIEPYRNVFLMPASNDPEVLKPILTQRIAAAMGKPLDEEERKNTMNEAMVWLKRLSTGELPGYKANGAESAILKAMRNEELNAVAVEAAGRLPGRAAQRELASLVLDEAVRAEVRASAALELARNIQTNSLVLAKNQIIGLERVFAKTEDARLRANVALALGAMRPDAYKTGERLKAFIPPLPGAEKPEPAMKGKEMEKEKAMEKEKMEKEKADKEEKKP